MTLARASINFFASFIFGIVALLGDSTTATALHDEQA